MNKPRIIILGPQGSGKGTQAGLLSRHFHIPHISAGDLLRDEARRGTLLGKKISKIIDAGRLVPNSVLFSVVKKRLLKPDARRGWILDGYPRFRAQAKTLFRFVKPSLVISLKLSDAQAIKRLGGRRVCPRGHIYHIDHDRPKRRGFCNYDGLPLKERADDTPAAIRKRLTWHHQQTDPLILDFHRKRMVVDIDAKPKIHDVFVSIINQVEQKPWQLFPATKTSRR